MQDPDLYAEGACVYQVDGCGNVVDIVAWARNQVVARRAFEALCEQYPERGFVLRQKARVMEERMRPSR